MEGPSCLNARVFVHRFLYFASSILTSTTRVFSLPHLQSVDSLVVCLRMGVRRILCAAADLCEERPSSTWREEPETLRFVYWRLSSSLHPRIQVGYAYSVFNFGIISNRMYVIVVSGAETRVLVCDINAQMLAEGR